jgi:hypothetical protein
MLSGGWTNGFSQGALNPLGSGGNKRVKDPVRVQSYRESRETPPMLGRVYGCE